MNRPLNTLKTVTTSLLCSALLALATLLPLHAETAAPAAKLNSTDILKVMERVADWQLDHASTNHPTTWVPAVEDTGMMALIGISGSPKYRDAKLAKGETNQWALASHKGEKYDADDLCEGQMYAELYLMFRERGMIAPLRERADFILDHPLAEMSLEFGHPKSREQWSWCDSLFMGPPTLARLTAATGDIRYLNFATSNWWRTTEYLYDTNEHLYFRDSTYFKKREANGAKIFWGRGNGWVLAGTARFLQYLPVNHPERARFQTLFKDMSAKILSLQQADGLWRASLLNPADYSQQEASGSSLYTYGLAWGVNQGLLDKATYAPAVKKAWSALTACVEVDGKLAHVQPVGADPRKFNPESTDAFGVGAFLLAGSELYRLSIFENSTPVSITLSNSTPFYRESETVQLNFRDIKAKLPGVSNVAVMDGVSSRIVDSQAYASDGGKQPDTFVFQTDIAPHEQKTFYLVNADALPAQPKPIVKTFARYVPERFDDFAWESDRIAHRTYGQALIKAEGTISSGPDVWIKRKRNLILDMMYRTKHYHEDNGDELDDYRVGKSRGCGGVGIWADKKLYVSGNYTKWKVITTGPVRSIFELTYDTWDAGDRKVSETKRYSIDAGSWFTRAQSVFSSDNKTNLTIGVGLAERSCGPGGVELTTNDLTEGWMTYWQPEDKPKGVIGVAIVLPANTVKEFTVDNAAMPEEKLHEVVPQPTHEGAPAIRNLLAIAEVEVGAPFSYYFGACWDRSGDFTNHEEWEAYVKRFAERRDSPLLVRIGR